MTTKGKVAIVGSGFVGQSWAMIFVGAGYQVTMYDIKEEQLLNATVSIQEQLLKVEADGLLRGSLSVQEQCDRISSTTDLTEAMKDAVWAQESVFEDRELKKKVFAQMDERCGADTIMASSTSCIAGSDFTFSLKHRGNCLVCHPCNPPYYCPAVEVVPTTFTDKAVTSKALEVMRSVGQVPILVKKEVPGFVLNRLQYALIGEAMRLVKDDVVSVEGVDQIMSEAMGMRYAFIGPLAVAHLNAPNGFADYSDRYGASITAVQKSFGPVPEFTPQLVEKIVTGLEKEIPGDKFADALEWRNKCITRVAKIKRELPPPK